jgi:hypothetical protein
MGLLCASECLAHPTPAFCMFVFCLLSFLHLLLLPVRFLGQAHIGRESISLCFQKYNVLVNVVTILYKASCTCLNAGFLLSSFI